MNGSAAERIEPAPAGRVPASRRGEGWGIAACGIAFALATTAAAIAFHRPFAGGIDDADITFTYARHLADGQGFVYNVGGERVEGATSPLWTLLCAGVFRLGGGEPAILGLCLGLCLVTQRLAGGILADLAADSVRHAPADLAADSPRHAPADLAADSVRHAPADLAADSVRSGGVAEAFGIYLVLTFSSPGYVVWMTTTLMDVTLWGTVTIAATAVAVRPPRTPSGRAIAAAVWCLLCLTRPEALWLGPALAVLAARRLRTTDPPAAARLFLLLGGVTAATLGGLTLFRLAYFGRPLPNTFYAKVAPAPEHNFAEGLAYLGDWLRACPVAAIGLATATGIVLHGLRAARRGPTALESLAWAALLFAPLPTATGGDHFAQHRFLQPLHPLLCLLAADGCRRLRPLAALTRRPYPGRAAAYVLGGALLVVSYEIPWTKWREISPLRHEFEFAELGRRTGTRLVRLMEGEPLPSIGIVIAGGIGRTYPGEKFDLMGLNDVRMANGPADRTRGRKNHSAFEPDLFYARPPDVVVVTFPLGDALFDFHDYALRGIFSEPRFRRAYVYGRLRRGDDPEPPLRSFFRRDWLTRLLGTGRYEFALDPDWERHLQRLPHAPEAGNPPRIE